MKVIEIDKNEWAAGIEKLKTSFELFGPVKGNNGYKFSVLGENEVPDLTCANTQLSPKSIVYPQSEVMFKYSLDENKEDAHMLKAISKEPTPRAIIGIRPCDAAAFLLVKRNFDSPEYTDPYWAGAYESTVFVGLACNAPCSTCFCTTAGCGPFHEEGLDVLLVDTDKAFLAKAITSRGKDFLSAAGWRVEGDAGPIEGLKQAAESKIKSLVATDKLKDKKNPRSFQRAVLGTGGLCLYQLRHLYLCLSDLLVFRHSG